MKDQLKKILTVALEEKYPEVKNIIIVPNEYIENKFDCVLNINYKVNSSYLTIPMFGS